MQKRTRQLADLPDGGRRRRLLGTALATAAAAALARIATPAVVGRLSRPPGAGTSAGRCAQCGSDGHTMLDPACPAAPGVV